MKSTAKSPIHGRTEKRPVSCFSIVLFDHWHQWSHPGCSGSWRVCWTAGVVACDLMWHPPPTHTHPPCYKTNSIIPRESGRYTTEEKGILWAHQSYMPMVIRLSGYTLSCWNSCKTELGLSLSLSWCFELNFKLWISVLVSSTIDPVYSLVVAQDDN